VNLRVARLVVRGKKSSATGASTNWRFSMSEVPYIASRFTVPRQRGAQELWLSAPGHQDTDLDLIIEGG